MKFFFEEEGIILAGVANNLEMGRVPKKDGKKQLYVLAPTQIAVDVVRASLNRVYLGAVEEASVTAEKYKVALTFALGRLSGMEPRHSLAVSAEFVAMAAILAFPDEAEDCVALLKERLRAGSK